MEITEEVFELLNNPILQFEYKRIVKSAQKSVYNRIWVWGYTPLIILTLVAVGALLLFPDVPLMQPHQVSFIAVPIVIIQTVLSLILLLRTLLRATLVTGRERNSNWNWEAFVLTGVDANTLIMGKWKAVIRSLRWEFLLLGIIRAVIFPVALILQRIHSEYHPYLAQGQYSLLDFIPTLPNLLLGVMALILVSFAQLPLMAAIGVLAASRRSTHPAGFGRGLSTWLLISMGTAFIIVLTFLAYSISVLRD